MEFFFNILAVLSSTIVLLATGLFLFIKSKHRYWKDRGIPGPEPHFFYGNIKDLFKLKMTESEIGHKWYNDYKDEPYIGTYTLWEPSILVRNMDMVKKIFETDFEHFMDHVEMRGDARTDSIFESLIGMKGEVWKERRVILNRVFTPKKIRDYIMDMGKSADILMKELGSNLKKDLELCHLVENHSIRTMCSTFFNLDVSNDKRRVQELADMAELFSRPPAATSLKVFLYYLAPKILSFFKVAIYPKILFDYFSSFSKQLLEAKCASGTKGDSFLDIIIGMKNEGLLKSGNITFEEVVGHVYVFFTGGNHTTELTISHCLVLLSLHQEHQEKVRKEVDEVTKGTSDITHEHVNSMKYLDAVILESMRVYTILGMNKRVCNKTYKLDDRFTIPKNMVVNIPVSGLQTDPQFYPDPEVFRPERFLDKDNSHQAFMPYGKGPRICVGKRFAEVFMKITLSKIISKYMILPSDNMKYPIKFDPKTILITNRPVEGLWIKLEERTST